MEPRLTFLIIFLLFIFFSPEQPNVRYYSRREQERLTIEKQEDFSALANSTYGDLPSKGLNLTGFRLEDGYQFQLLPTAQDLSRRQQVDSWYGFNRQTPVYHDIRSEVRGGFERVATRLDPEKKPNLTVLDPGTDYLNNLYDRNVTDQTGELFFVLEGIGEASKWLTREIKATLSVTTDLSPGNGWDARLRGVHFPSGSVVLTTSSRKYNALPALPHFTLMEQEFMRSNNVMNKSLTEIWRTIDQGNTDDASIFVAPKCELIVWLHQKPLIGNSLYIAEIEDELSNPDGAPIGEAPPIAFTALVFSPDCGYILQANTVYGPKTEVFHSLIARLTAAFCFILVGQILLIKRQMEKCATPSTRSRVSYHTFFIAAFGDGLTFFALLGLVMVNNTVFLVAGAAAFLACVHVAFLEVKFIFDIWTVQVGDPANAELDRQRRAAALNSNRNATTGTTSNVDTNPPTQTQASEPVSTAAAVASNQAPTVRLSEAGLPLPATAVSRTSPTSPPTIIITPDQDGSTTTTTNTGNSLPTRTTFASLYTRFYFALLNLAFFTLWTMSWSPGARHVYLNLLVFAYFSLWLPQIYRNVLRNCRKALTWEYMLGTSTLRALPILYWYIMPRNILYADLDSRMAFVLTLWLFTQIIILAVQQFLGPRTLIPESWCPPAYDYHPILYDDLEAGGLPIGEITSASEGKDADNKTGGSRKIFDCAICMNEIDVPVVSKDEKKQGGAGGTGMTWLEQRNYMVTPCRHIFHTECLDGWMNMRLVCPVCRESLPPL